MNIGIVTHNFPSHNAEGRAAAGNFVVPLCKELCRRGNTVCVVTPDAVDKNDDYPFFVERFGTMRKNKLLGHYKLWNPLDIYGVLNMLDTGVKKLDFAVEKYRIDVLLALWAFPAGYLCSRTKVPVPYYTWCLGSDIWTLGKVPVANRMIANVLGKSERIYADGLQLAKDAELLAKKACGFLPTTRLLEKNEPALRTIAEGRTSFLFVGRWEKAKGPDLFLRAAHMLLQNYPDMSFRMFGGGSMAKSVSAFGVRLHNLYGDRFFLGGYLSEKEFKRELAATSCFVIPSRKESVPIALTDAVSANVPVVVSTAGDMGYWVKRYELGLVFTKDNLNGLLESLRSVAAKPLSMRPNDREAYLKTFSIDSVVDSLLCDMRQGR